MALSNPNKFAQYIISSWMLRHRYTPNEEQDGTFETPAQPISRAERRHVPLPTIRKQVRVFAAAQSLASCVLVLQTIMCMRGCLHQSNYIHS